MGISVVINTYNAEKYLEKVLRKVQDFDEILICDMYSDDETVRIAEEYNCRIIFHEKIGFVEPARNKAIQAAQNEWVLLLDADEMITEDLKQYIHAFKNSMDENVCLAIPRKNYFMGKFMRSAYPDYVYRFFKKENVFWPEFIHSKPEIRGNISKINKKRKNFAIEHLASDDIFSIIHKNNLYSTAEILRRNRERISLAKLFFSPLFWFLKYYFMKGGIRDGKEGFIFSILKAQYKLNTLAKVFESQKKT